LEALLIWVCAALGQLAAIGSIFALSMITLLSLVGFGLMFNVLIVAIILGKLAVSRTLRRYHESLRQLKKDSPVPAAGGPH
jgi:ABC-type transport system involved in cytochrome bd biosynthesis fused ATPase/permease subunit